jgi:hypothetical protein
MSEARWDLKASSTEGPLLAMGLGAVMAPKRACMSTLGFVHESSAHSS